MIITADSTARFLYDLELAVDKHLEVVAEYYSYLRQPFLDLRELSLDQLNSVKRLIDSGLFGNRVVAEHQAKVPLLQQEYGDSLDNIIELQLLYYKDTCKVFKSKWEEVFDPWANSNDLEYFDVLKCEMDLCHIVDMKPLIGQQMRSVDEKLCTESISYWNSTILSLKNQQVKLVNKVNHRIFDYWTLLLCLQYFFTLRFLH